MTEDHERAMAKLEKSMTDERKENRDKLQKTIDELIDRLRHQTLKSAGVDSETHKMLRTEVSDLQRQLSERTAQLADVSQ